MKNKIQYILVTLALSFVFAFNAQAQSTSQKIGNNPTNITPSAALEVESATKGVLFPRVALTSITDVLTVPSPANGLTVFNTTPAGTSPNNVTVGYYYFNAATSKWVKLAIETPPIAFAKTVYINSATPGTATKFAEANPPETNDDLLKAKDDNLYVANDGSTWTYDMVNNSYKTYAIAPSTPFYLKSTTTDALYEKNNPIWRPGNLGVGTNNPLTKLHLQGATAVQTANANESLLRLSRPGQSGVKWDNIAQFNLGTYFDDPIVFPTTNNMDAKSRLDIALTNGASNTNFTTVMTWLANGRVGIGTTAPGYLLHLNSSGNATAFLETSNTTSGQTSIDFKNGTLQAWRLVGQGSVNGQRFDIHNQTNNSPAFSVMPDNKIGIGTVGPTAQLEVATAGSKVAVFKRGASTLNSASNIYIQRTQSDNPSINTAGTGGADAIGRIIFSMAHGTSSSSYPADGNASIGSFYVAPQTTSNYGGGLTFRTVNSGTTTPVERLRVEHNGNVGIGNYNNANNEYVPSDIPGSKLEVDGSSTNKSSFNAGTSTVIDFSKSNLAYTSASPGAFTINNIKDGGTYTLAVKGTIKGTSTFLFPSGFGQKGPGVGAETVSGMETLYTFLVIGNTVYVYMTAGI